MQNRYVGDIGDLAKYALLRRLSAGKRLGVAWYLFPDEAHNADGRHVGYLDDPARWRGLDPALFDTLARIVQARIRTVAEVEASRILGVCVFSSRPLSGDGSPAARAAWRGRWFVNALAELARAEIVFADPDNGLCLDASFRPARPAHWKRLPLSEAVVLGRGRCAVVYHHNTRSSGGHEIEILRWLGRLPMGTLAVRVRARSPRTFFILNATREVARRARDFAATWPTAELYPK